MPRAKSEQGTGTDAGFERLALLAPGCALASRCVVLGDVSSTMDEARSRLVKTGTPLLVIAEHQSEGRGRSGRSWLGARGLDLMFTAALRFPPEGPALPAFTLAVGVALHRTMESMLGQAGQTLTLKWPNDLWIGSRKVAGVLCEAPGTPSGTSRQQDRIVLVGVGLDVNSTRFPPGIGQIATSLALETGSPFDRASVLAALCVAIEEAASAYALGGFAAFAHEYRTRCKLWGRRCEVDGREGVMRSVDTTGALIIDLPDGTSAQVSSGHVEMLPEP